MTILSKKIEKIENIENIEKINILDSYYNNFKFNSFIL
jgi:hypothetical protein